MRKIILLVLCLMLASCEEKQEVEKSLEFLYKTNIGYMFIDSDNMMYLYEGEMDESILILNNGVEFAYVGQELDEYDYFSNINGEEVMFNKIDDESLTTYILE